jgi:hypothetical protein
MMPVDAATSAALSRAWPQYAIAGAAAALFIAMFVLGWLKQRYGFSMMDEGMYMADGWRLAAGDRLFPDSAVTAVMLYTTLNALVFKWVPDITLLGFRELQQVLALAELAVFGAAVYRWTHRPSLIVLTLSVFAFTGLAVAGMNGSLSYYTYAHLFFVLHVALLLFALDSKRAGMRAALLAASGALLWAVGFSFVPLAATLLIPPALRIAARALGCGDGFTNRDLQWVMAPGLALWGIFLAVYGAEFMPALLDDLRYIREGGIEGGFDRVPLQYVAVIAVYAGVLAAMSRLAVPALLAAGAAASVLMFFVIDTNGFGVVTSFWRAWFPRQMWFCALLIVGVVALLAHLVYCRRRAIALSRDHWLLLVLILPSGLFALIFSQFSVAGVLTTTYAAAPIAMAIALFIAIRLEKAGATPALSTVAVAALLAPFYYHLARADWEFTSFDLPPKLLNRVIPAGFGTGIHTSDLYYQAAQWMTQTAQEHSRESDFAIVMDQSPMGYMLIKRRPALNHSYTGWAISFSLRREAVDKMLRERREPKIAYRFLWAPMILPPSPGAPTYRLGDRFNYPANDPISQYVTSRMRHLGTFTFKNQPLIELYVRD